MTRGFPGAPAPAGMHLRLVRSSVFAIGLVILIPSVFAGSAGDDWEKVIALDAGPLGELKSRELARTVTLQHLAKQEAALGDFLKNHADDPRVLNARLRLAHLLATRGDLQPKPGDTEAARKILDDIEKNPATPKERVADATFGKISIYMQSRREPDDAERESLLGQARQFQVKWPGDKRLAPLLAEIATLFDAQPKKKESLLRDALPLAENPDLKKRIEDDLKRIAMLGQPVELKFTATDGRAVNIADFRGKVVIVYFFANWSPPSLMGLTPMRELSRQPGVQTIGISLDETKIPLEENLKRFKIDWPVFFDGKGWESPLIRSLGINALPTVWLLDRKGNLRTLNARRDVEGGIRQLRGEK